MKLTAQQKFDLLPKIQLKGEKKPTTQVWLTQKDALNYADQIESAASEHFQKRIDQLEEIIEEQRRALVMIKDYFGVE
jgi:hypothetical protein